ncbi:sigma factor [Actinoplanes sp. G11-F43]|uniref:sigma factor n=1 Tax=Actinoplanes sp. G11-F43 TaxID=3424130 RepID=UPI003D329603
MTEDLDTATEVFAEVRGRLFGIAYRMLSSASEAEDLVQETWLRWQTCDRSAVRNPGAFLATTITRLAINALRSARVRRETYVGPWLPEPVDTSADPCLGAERGEALQFAVLTSTEPAVRQLVSRARKHVDGRRKVTVDADAQRALLEGFIAAARTGDMSALERLFRPDVASVSDGDGAHQVARRPVVGPVRVARFYATIASWFWAGAEVTWVSTNGATSAVISRNGSTESVISVVASADGIENILWMANPGRITAF